MTQREINEKNLENVKYFCRGNATVTINNDGDIDVDGTFNCSYKSANIIKEGEFIVTFGKVTGEFDCSRCRMVSLKGCPKEVGGSFNCSHNSIESLDGCPSKVGKDFNCKYNLLDSLEFMPKKINGDFDCSCNNLNDLSFVAKEIGGDFICRYNRLSGIKDGPEKVGGITDTFGNNINSSNVKYIESAEK